jgi:hypothetical protein
VDFGEAKGFSGGGRSEKVSSTMIEKGDKLR